LLAALPDAPARFPGIPFTAIYATRNQLSHGYFSINPERVWEVVDRDIPILRKELESAIAAWDAAPPQP
jgi:uncharacterized protein with HEPN domain